MYLPTTDSLVARSTGLSFIVARSSSCYYNSYGEYICPRRSAWLRFGRWLLAGILIFLGLLLLLLFCCLALRRKRKAKKYEDPQVTTAAPMATTTAAPVGYNNNVAAGPVYGQQETKYAPPAGPPPVNHGYGQESGIAKPQGTYIQ